MATSTIPTFRCNHAVVCRNTLIDDVIGVGQRRVNVPFPLRVCRVRLLASIDRHASMVLLRLESQCGLSRFQLFITETVKVKDVFPFLYSRLNESKPFLTFDLSSCPLCRGFLDSWDGNTNHRIVFKVNGWLNNTRRVFGQQSNPFYCQHDGGANIFPNRLFRIRRPFHSRQVSIGNARCIVGNVWISMWHPLPWMFKRLLPPEAT